MEGFNLVNYYSELNNSHNINDCPKVPCPKIENNQNYIFISYSHEDYKQVYKALAFLYVNGVRFWYDKDFTVGMNWETEAKKKIRHPNCSGVLFFLSKNLFLSCAVVNIELPCVLAIDASGNKTNDLEAMNYFAVNLSDSKPSELIGDALNDCDLDTTAIALICKAFPNKDIYISANEFEYENKLLSHIRNSFDDTVQTSDSDANKPIYYGLLKDGKYHGKGKLIFPENDLSDLYYGDFKNGKFDGKGHKFLKNGAHFEGQFVDGQRNGHGIYRYADGDVYEGNWINGRIEGYGKYVYANGDVYEGEWKNNKRNGKGVYIYSNGGIFEGEFVDDNPNGYGEYRGINGTVRKGLWQDGKLKIPQNT